MKYMHKIVFTTAVLMTTGAAAGVELGVNAMSERELPVLVQVNSKGKVTRVLPALPLSPVLTRSLRDTIRSWVIGPAIDKKMRPVASQMIMRVSLFVTPSDNGKYDVRFHYVSRQAAASANGSSFWRWNGNQLALVTDPNGMRGIDSMGGYAGGFSDSVSAPGLGSTGINFAGGAGAIAASGGSSVSNGGGGHGGGTH